MLNLPLVSHPHDICAFVIDAVEQRRGAALIFVTAVEGGGVRAPGLRMAVDGSGRHVGYISNGCVEADLIAQALTAISTDRTIEVSYGRGSGNIDIVLPCGGRVDVSIVPAWPNNLKALQAVIATPRQGGQLRLSSDGSLSWSMGDVQSGLNGHSFQINPKVRLLVIGSGSEALLLAHLGCAADLKVTVYSPDDRTLEHAGVAAIPAHRLLGLSAPLRLEPDEMTAIALMFHDHEWEQRILCEALDGPAFYIGALGSFRAQQRRVESLAASGIPADQIARIKAPIGLVHQLRDPNLLAASVLAEIAAEFQKRFVAF